MTAVIGNAVINKMTYKSPFLKHNSCRDNGYAAKSIHTMLAPVPNTTRLIDTRKEVKKFPSPKIFLYDRRLNPTGQRATFPALTASLLLKETQRTYHTGRMQTSVIKIRITTFTTSNTFDPILLFSIIYCTSLE